MNTCDIYDMIMSEFVITGECYGDSCKYCKYYVNCSMHILAACYVLGGAYHG